MPEIALALIVRDEEDALPQLLKSVEGAVDFVACLDTGSEDATVEIFKEWAEGVGVEHVVGEFAWDDDFGAAREAAHALIPERFEWHVWADADDVLVNPAALRQIADQAPDEITGFMFDYDYILHPMTGEPISVLRRERLVRATWARKWAGRVHECILLPPGTSPHVERDVCRWVHRKQNERIGQSNPRNIQILRRWAQDEPDNPRVIGYLATELVVGDKPDEALEWFARYRALEVPWGEERAQMARKEALALISLDRLDEARACADEAFRWHPQWPDTHLTYAELAAQEARWPTALFHAEQVLAIGQPETLLILNPIDYTGRPRLVRGLALEAMGRLDEALADIDRAVTHMPEHPIAAQAYYRLRSNTKVEQTVKTWVAMARQLISHDEQLKALRVLETVPHYAESHHEIVKLRVWLRRRIGWAWEPMDYAEHYESGGSKPEDFIPLERVDGVAGGLTRARLAYEELCDLCGVEPRQVTREGTLVEVKEAVAA